MITEIEIENLRGIRSGRLAGLAPLTILTGPNASGKSTVLDGLLIATSPTPELALGQAIARRKAVLGGAKWLLGDPNQQARLEITTDSGSSWKRQLKWFDHCVDKLQERLIRQRELPPYSMILVDEDSYSDDARSGWAAFGLHNQFEIDPDSTRGSSDVSFVELIDPGIAVPLHQTFTAVARTGRRADVYELLSVLVPQFEGLEILTEDSDTPSLFLTSAGRSVPVGLAGDGVQAFVQLALSTAVAPNGLVLVEEPEVYQHPRAIRQTALALLANMRRGVQIVLSTHSLELIDAFLAEASEDDLEKMALFNLLLEEGSLTSGRRAGKDIAFARQTLENDLR